MTDVDVMGEESIGFKARMVSMFLRLLTLGLIAVALVISTEGIVIVLLLFVLVVPFEKLFPRHCGQKVRRPHLDTDVGYALVSPLWSAHGVCGHCHWFTQSCMDTWPTPCTLRRQDSSGLHARGRLPLVRCAGVLDAPILSRDSGFVEISRHPPLD